MKILEELETKRENLLVVNMHLIEISKMLIKNIEKAIRYNPASNKYQIEFLEQIDKELENGQEESRFWRDKLKLQKLER